MISNRKEVSIDVALEYTQRHKIMAVKSNDQSLKGCHFPYHTYAIVVDRFAFQVHCHDTGNSVRGYILTDDKPYEIINATFWKQSGYEHNKDTWLRGAWDESLLKTIDEIKGLVEKHQEVLKQDDLNRQETQRAKELSEKSKVEAMFS